MPFRKRAVTLIEPANMRAILARYNSTRQQKIGDLLSWSSVTRAWRLTRIPNRNRRKW
jgi:hypothetical protein